MNNARYLRVSQSILNWHVDEQGRPKAMRLAEVITTAEELGKNSQEHVYIAAEEDGQPTVRWGTAVYEVQADGVLKMLTHKLDTGD
jgi:hypothetical protein